MKETISVIIPMYNVEHYIENTIQSCLNQSYENVEILIIDDGSTDRSYEIASGFMAQDQRVRILRKDNGGVSSARNMGIDNAIGEYCLFLDGDDWLDIDACEILLAYMHQYPTYIIDSKRWETGDRGDFTIWDRETALSQIGSGKDNLTSACFKVYSIDIIKKNNLRFDETISHGEDGLFVYEYLLNADGVVRINARIWNCTTRPDSATHSLYNSKKKSMLVAVQKMIEISPDSQVTDVLERYYLARTRILMDDAIKCGISQYSEDLLFLRNEIRSHVPLANNCSFIEILLNWMYMVLPYHMIGWLKKIIWKLKSR